MISAAHDVAKYLAAQGAGTFPGTLSVSVEPMTPVDVTTIYDTGGEPPDTDQQDLLRSTFQVRTRSVDYETGYSKQTQIRDLLILPGRIVTADSAFVMISMTSDIASIGRDDQDRYLMTANYRVIRERS